MSESKRKEIFQNFVERSQEELEEWADRMVFENDIKLPEDPVEFLEDNLTGVEESGVELQEQANEARTDEVLN